METKKPLLDTYGVPSSKPAEVLATRVDQSTGLMFSVGGAVPLVEEVIGGAHNAGTETSTVMINGQHGDHDPDLFRNQTRLSTLVTKAEIDPADPDLVRTVARTDLLGTTQTFQSFEQVDPDLVRPDYRF